MLEAVGAGSRPRVGDRDWADIWKDSPELANVKDTISQMKESRKAAASQVDPSLQQEYATPFLHQMKIVAKRTNLSLWRSPNYLFTRVFNHIAIAIMTGLVYLNLDDSRSSLQNKVFVMFQITVLPALVMSQVEAMFIFKRAIFFREQSSKMYSTWVFTASVVMAELPYSVLCAVLFYLPLYFMPGFQTEPTRAGYQFLMILITELFAVTMGQVLASISPSAFISSQYDPFIVITFALFCGVTIPPPQMPGFWRAWLYQLDPFTRLIGGAVTTALDSLQVHCLPEELNVFSAPADTTCGDYMVDFFDGGGPGYLVDPNATHCEYCAYRLGNEFFEPLGFSYAYRWRDLGIFAAFIGSNLIILFLAVSLLYFCLLDVSVNPQSLDHKVAFADMESPI